MSLGIVVKGPEGVVLAADTRITLTANRKNAPPLNVNFDNATKILTFGEPHNHVAAVTYGAAVIGKRPAHSYIPELELELGKGPRESIQAYAEKISAFFQARWKEANPSNKSASGEMTFIVGGYDEDAPYGAVFLFTVPNKPSAEARNEDGFGMTWGGQSQIASRIMQGFDPALLAILKQVPKLTSLQVSSIEKSLEQLRHPVPFDILALQDCVDLATFLIRTTMAAQDLAIGLRGVGGTIEVASITRAKGFDWVQRKELHGESH